MAHEETKPLGIFSSGEDSTSSSSDSGSSDPKSKVSIRYLIRALLKFNASDLHLKASRPPLFRINGKLVPAKMEEMDAQQLQTMLLGILSGKQKVELEEKKQLDLSFESPGLGRFRCNIYYQKGSIAAAFRMISSTVPDLEKLHLPAVLKELCHKKKGLVLITGSTGSGKSTTLAAMIQHINENRSAHVLCIEDPIEFVFRDQKASITQREIGSDTPSFKDAMLSSLRQDPDVIMLGELRDPITIQTALTAAETGHLVLATLHTNDCKSSIERILDVMQPEAQNQTRIQLASTLVGVISQQLVMREDLTGRVLACEVMIKSPSIESYILNNEIDRITQAISSSNSYYHMVSMNQALQKLVKNKTISLNEALKSSPNPDDLKLLMAGVDRSEGY